MKKKTTTRWGKSVLFYFTSFVGGIWAWSYLLVEIKWAPWSKIALVSTCVIYFVVIVANLAGSIALWVDQHDEEAPDAEPDA